jgi:hypothetical protein
MPDDYWVEVDRTHKFRFIGGPIENPQANINVFFIIGQAAASWARMEQHIDAILMQINKEKHSDEFLDLYNPYHPGTFDKKLKMLRSYFNKHPALSEYTETVIDCADGLKKLSEDRNSLLHWVLEDYDETAQTITITGTKYRPKTDDFQNLHVTSPAARYVQFARLVNLAHYTLCEVSKTLFTADAVAQLQRQRPPTRPWWRRLLDRCFGTKA